MTTQGEQRSESAYQGDQIDALVDAAADIAGASATLVANLLGHVDRLVDDVLGDARTVAGECDGLWNVAQDSLRAAADLARAAPRFTRVAGELLWVIGEYRWQMAISGTRRDLLGAASDDEALAALHERTARRLYALCVELRGGVLKLGQFASTRMDLLPDAYVRELSRLQDRVPALPLEPILAQIAEELGAPAGDVFAEFDVEPIAAASLAQVHAASLADGSRVAVKVQVPGIEAIVEADLAALRMAAPALADLVPFVDLATVASEMTRAVRMELDYLAEARHAAAFARLFAADPDVVVPRVFSNLSSERVLVLEHIAGERLLDYLDACAARGEAGARDRDRLFEVLVRCFCAQVLEHGLLHADPHPGNFLVVPAAGGPRLALLDFGCVQAYPPERRRAYAELGLAVLAGDADRLSALFETLGFRSRDGRADGMHAFADLILAAFRRDAKGLADFDPTGAFQTILHLTRDNPIVAIPGDFVLLGRVFAVLGGLLMRYRPRLNLFGLLMPQLARAVAPQPPPSA